MFIGAILGARLAPSAQWATAPIAAMVVGTAIAAYPLVTLMHRIGRKPVFIGSLLLVSAACLLIAFALYWQSFFLFCTAILLIGMCMAAIQQFRFAAMESVAKEQMATAASAVMLAGVAAAFVGPELVFLGQHWFDTEFAGSFLVLATAYVACCLLIGLYQQPRELAIPVVDEAPSPRALFARPLFRVAVFGGAIGFAVMTFVMTATPISMHDHNGHSLADTKWVIQSHVSAMFLPSLLLPYLVRRVGAQAVMGLGAMCYCVAIAIGLLRPDLWNFWFALVFLGVGWNFLFLGATTLLPSTHPPQQHLQAQAVNDTVVFGLQAVAALSSGLVLNLWGWHTVLVTCLPLILALFVLQVTGSRKHRLQSSTVA